MLVRANHRFDHSYPELAWVPALGGFEFLRRELDRAFFRDEDRCAQRNLGTKTGNSELSVLEETAAYVVHANLPGLREADIDVTVAGKQLTITAERKATEPEGYTAVRKERTRYRLERTIALPTPIDAGKVEAQLTNGLLTIRLPKVDEPKPQRITVKSL